jgi:hypothetical protein
MLGVIVCFVATVTLISIFFIIKLLQLKNGGMNVGIAAERLRPHLISKPQKKGGKMYYEYYDYISNYRSNPFGYYDTRICCANYICNAAEPDYTLAKI